MKLTVLGSNSLGNSYILEASNEVLLFEAGIKLAEVKKALKFDMTRIVGCLVTHQHNDHSGRIREYMNAGILTLAIEEVFASKSISSFASFRKLISPWKGYRIGNFKVFAFPVSHDVPCVGFVIDHPESGKILFITDTMTCDYSFDGLHHIMIEANYADDILDANIASGKIPVSMRTRLLGTHMELESTKKILLNQDLSQVRNIVLIHLSDGNSHEVRFEKEVNELTGKHVVAANKGTTVNFSSLPF